MRAPAGAVRPAPLRVPADPVGHRMAGEPPDRGDFVDGLAPGWQQERTDNFSAVMIGRPVDVDLVGDAWTEYMARVANFTGEPGMAPDEVALAAEAFDYAVMEEHRVRVDDGRPRPDRRRGAQAVLPLPVQAAAVPRRVPRRVQRAQRHARRLPGGHRRASPPPVSSRTAGSTSVDCIVYATGFEAEVTPFPPGRGRDRRSRRGLDRDPVEGRARGRCTGS